MLPIKRRVKKDSFPLIVKKGVFLNGENFYLRYLHNNTPIPSLFSFIVPLKVKKTSVGRHFIKRKMTAVVEKALPEIKTGFLCLIFVKMDISKIPFQDIKIEIVDLLKKAKIIE